MHRTRGNVIEINVLTGKKRTQYVNLRVSPDKLCRPMEPEQGSLLYSCVTKEREINLSALDIRLPGVQPWFHGQEAGDDDFDLTLDEWVEMLQIKQPLASTLALEEQHSGGLKSLKNIIVHGYNIYEPQSTCDLINAF